MENSKNKERVERVKRWAILIACAAALLTSCAITINNVNHSQNVKIENKQNATQKNDSTNFNLKDLVK